MHGTKHTHYYRKTLLTLVSSTKGIHKFISVCAMNKCFASQRMNTHLYTTYYMEDYNKIVS